MEEEKKTNKRIVFSIIAVLLLVVVVAGATYAYFSATASTNTQTVTTGTLTMGFTNGDLIRATNITPISDSEIKTKATELPFSVTNTGNQHMKLTIKLTDITISEELKDIDFRWGLFNTATGNALSRGVFADLGTSNELTIYTDTIIDAAEPDITNSYVLRIWIHDDRTVQDSLMGKSFSARVKVTGEAVEYTDESCFTFNSSTGAITGYDATTCGTDVVVPKTISGNTVTSFNAMYDNSTAMKIDYKSIILPNTITSMSFDALSIKSTTLTIPEGVTIFPRYIESNNLSQVFLPDTITNMTLWMKMSSSLVIPFSTTTLNTEYISGNIPTNYILHDNLTTINKFGIGNSNINSLEIPASVTSIKSKAFMDGLDLTRANDLEIILLGKTEIPDTFETDWNCISIDIHDHSICTKYATVTFRP